MIRFSERLLTNLASIGYNETMDPKQRFSTRVDNYIKYRPGYPVGVMERLRNDCGLKPSSIIADIGSGTGLLARLFLDFGCRVYGVEPNAEMRSAGERLLAGFSRFTSLEGTAEAIGLPDNSVDFISAGQAFHWFQPDQARMEFQRILKPGGWVVLVWNERRLDSTPFLRAYEVLLQTFATDYNQVNHRNVEQDPHIIPNFFAGGYKTASFDNVQIFDFEGVKGRLDSSSYTPQPGQPKYEAMLAELYRIFNQYQQDGRVNFEYNTEMYYGRLKG